MLLWDSKRNSEKQWEVTITHMRHWFEPEFAVRPNECDFLVQSVGWWISWIPGKQGFCLQGDCLSTEGKAGYQPILLTCTGEALLCWFLVDSLPNACKLLQTHTKDFLTLEKCLSVFRVCAVWVLLRLYCPEVTSGQRWRQCFLFVSDLSGKKYMKIKQKYAVC